MHQIQRERLKIPTIALWARCALPDGFVIRSLIIGLAAQHAEDADEKMTEPAMTRPIPHHHDQARGSKNQITFSDPVAGRLCPNQYNRTTSAP